MPKRGRFIVIEGPDGTGKSTQVRLLTERLAKLRIKLISPREPGATAAGEAIRDVLLNRKNFSLTPVTEALLFQAARSQLVSEIIEPALSQGTWVLCDRFALSTLIYQGYVGGVSPEKILQLTDLATRGVKPDLQIILDAPWELCLQRRSGRVNAAISKKKGGKDRMEAKGDAFLKKVFNAYHKLARHAPKGVAHKTVKVDASGDVEQVSELIFKTITRAFPIR